MSTTAAFFDLDGTLIPAPSSEMRFLAWLLRKGVFSPRQILAGLLFFPRWFFTLGQDTGRKNKAFYAGLSVKELEGLGQQWVNEHFAGLLFQEMASQITACRQAGKTCVLMTGAPTFLANPISKALNLDAVIATECVSRHGTYTSAPPRQHPLGYEKLLLASKWCQANGINLEECTAYGDSHQDWHLLNAVKHPFAINPDNRMAKLAASAQWPVINTV